jgi:hypothetical protein
LAQQELRDAMELVMKDFAFLVGHADLVSGEDDAHSVGDFALVFRTTDLRIELSRDRGLMFVMLAPASPALGCPGRPCHSLTTVISLLIGRQVFIDNYVQHRWLTSDDKQLKLMARVFRFYQHRVVQLFRPGAYQEWEPALKSTYKDLLSVVSHGSIGSEYERVWSQSEQFWQGFLDDSDRQNAG